MFEVGRICMKIAGREAGNYCVILKKLDENFVLITGPKEVTNVKRRRCNINHLEPLMEKISIKPDASDADVIKAYEEASIFQKLQIKRPEKKIKVERKAEKVKEEKKPKAAMRKEKSRKETGKKKKSSK